MDTVTPKAPFNPERLRAAQLAKQRTSESLAREIGVGVRVVQHWRAGTSNPRGVNVNALSLALDVPVGWFYESSD